MSSSTKILITLFLLIVPLAVYAAEPLTDLTEVPSLIMAGETTEDLNEIMIAKEKVAEGLTSLAEVIRGIDSQEILKFRIGMETEIEKSFQNFHESIEEAKPILAGFMLAIVFVTGAVLLALAGRYTTEITHVARNKLWIALLVGILAMFLPPLIAILLAASMVGLALSMIVLFAWLILLIVAKVMAGFLIGSFIIKLDANSKYGRRLLAFLIGTLILAGVVWLIPGFGLAIGLVAFVITAGAAVLTEFKLYKQLKKAKLI